MSERVPERMRFEYIGPDGREFILRGSFTVSWKNDGRTLKVFGNVSSHADAEKAEAVREALEQQAAHFSSEARFYDRSCGQRDGVPFPKVAAWYRVEAVRLRALAAEVKP